MGQYFFELPHLGNAPAEVQRHAADEDQGEQHISVPHEERQHDDQNDAADDGASNGAGNLMTDFEGQIRTDRQCQGTFRRPEKGHVFRRDFEEREERQKAQAQKFGFLHQSVDSILLRHLVRFQFKIVFHNKISFLLQFSADIT